MSSRGSGRRWIGVFAAATVALGLPVVAAAWHAQCTETWNPHGQNVPPAGRTTEPGTSPRSGQNPDGFYQVGAVADLVSLEPASVWLLDGCGAGYSGHVYDGDPETPGVQPFSFGTTVKYVEANGRAPGQRRMATANKPGEPYDGASDWTEWQLWGQGDLMVCDGAEALDAFAHVAPRCVCCYVPPPPRDCEFTDCAPGPGADLPTIRVTDSVAPEEDLDVDFGDVAGGSTVTASVTVANVGTAPLDVGTLGVTAPFALQADGCSETALAPGESCTALLSFQPIASGVVSGTLSIPSNDPSSPTVVVTLHGNGTAAAGPLRLVFVVNEDYYTISAADLAFTAETASAALAAATGRSYAYDGATWGRYGATNARDIFRQYVFSHPQDLPDYVVIFTKDVQAVTYGGYMLPSFGVVADEDAWQRASTPSYCNPAGSPYRAPGEIYGSVVDWSHLLGGCGYELQGLEYVHVSDVSFDGQCRNQPGLTCVFEYGEWQCPNLLADPEVAPQLADRRLWVANTIDHELLHNFGEGAPPIFDHVCPAGTPEDVVAQSAFNICGTTIVALSAAGESCVADRP